MRPIAMVPTYNEAGNIGRLLEEVLSQDGRIEAVVVDDDSPDGTGGIVREMSRGEPRIHLLSRKGVRGRTSAGTAGFRYAIENGYDVVIEMDADFSHDPKYIPAMLRGIEGTDVVVGSRYVEGGGTKTKAHIQHLLSKFANYFNIFVLGLPVKDSSGGYKCYRADVLKSIDLDHFISTGYSVGAEILYRCKKAGFMMREIPIVFNPRASGSSKLNWRIILAYPFAVIRLRLTV
ncbi:MAG: polyprenol monophosphomannose synthase [Candidatus Altiarchaeota archaeon]